MPRPRRRRAATAPGRAARGATATREAAGRTRGGRAGGEGRRGGGTRGERGPRSGRRAASATAAAGRRQGAGGGDGQRGGRTQGGREREELAKCLPGDKSSRRQVTVQEFNRSVDTRPCVWRLARRASARLAAQLRQPRRWSRYIPTDDWRFTRPQKHEHHATICPPRPLRRAGGQ